MKKIFIIENQKNISPWSDSTRSVVGIAIFDRTLRVRKLKGIDPTLEGFLYVLREIREELNKINNEFVRKSPYKVNAKVGMSGCRTWQISFIQNKDEFWIEKRKDILYISCFGKVPDQDIFIPDLALILEDLVAQLPEEHDINVTEIVPITPETGGYVLP